MLVVSDTSPICNLACIGRLQLLRSQFGTVCIPPAVKAELADLPAAMGGAAVEEALREGWISVRPVEKPELANLLARELHQGESEALALATQLAADLVLLDEREARRVAQRLHLRVTGTLGVLLRAKYSGAIPSLTAEINALRAKAGFFISTELEHRILREAGER
mgnify:CR=1 FL=1